MMPSTCLSPSVLSGDYTQLQNNNLCASRTFLRLVSYPHKRWISCKEHMPADYYSSHPFICVSNVEALSENQICQAYGNSQTILADPDLGTETNDVTVVSKPFIFPPSSQAKKIVLVRHGLSSWNEDNRIQGSSDLSVLSNKGELQAKKCKEALASLKFDHCFASPITRAKSSAELIWEGRTEPLVYLDSLREANLRFLEGMRNVDARQKFPEAYKAWREDPANFQIDGSYPVVELWEKAKKSWQDIFSVKGEMALVVTHKSILRALICTALGMGPERFRAIDINNGGVSIFTINRGGDPMLQSLNMISHLHTDGVLYSV